VKILSAAQINQWDQFTIAQKNINSVDLMEQAATACVNWLLQQYPQRHFIIFCGPGNNGGDGLAIARLLAAAGLSPQVFMLAAPRHSADFDENLERLKETNLPILTIHSEADFPEVSPHKIIIDAIFGTGLNKAPEGLTKNLIEYLNLAETDIISIDIPSGMYCDSSSVNNSIVRASTTLSFEAFKLCFLLTENLPFCGNIVLLDIDLSREFLSTTETSFYLTLEKDIKKIFRPRKAWVHKYQLGHALVDAGSKNMMGAALLACKACMRAGCGLVTLFNHTSETAQLNSYLPELISSTESDFDALLHKKNAICFGPGLVVDETNTTRLEKILSTAKLPVLIDAAGLSILKKIDGLSIPANAARILTPHQGEFDMLFGRAANDVDRIRLALQQAQDYSIHIILKGPHTMIVCPDGNIYFNSTGNSGMATAGAGDVLSGIITAMLAQGYETKHACILGVYLHGLAGDIAAGKLSKESLLASDIIENIGDVFLQLNKLSNE
jgi:hydroxyethylthiazole kinase-like uncharacterized protein yjeF